MKSASCCHWLCPVEALLCSTLNEPRLSFQVQKKWDSHDKDLEEVPALEENHLKPHEGKEPLGSRSLVCVGVGVCVCVET